MAVMCCLAPLVGALAEPMVIAPPTGRTVQHMAYTDASCTANPRMLKALELGACQRGYATSWQMSFVCLTPNCPSPFGPGTPPGQKPADGTLVITGVNNATTCTESDAGSSQWSNSKPFQCDAWVDGSVKLWSQWEIVKEPCQPDCDLCAGLYGMKQCDYIPSTVPETPFNEALPGCMGCAAELFDNDGCSCSACWPNPTSSRKCAPGMFCPPPPGPRGPPGCIGGMCSGVLGVPCMDCGVTSGGNTTECRRCMLDRVNDPSLGGLCDFMLRGLCNPDSC